MDNLSLKKSSGLGDGLAPFNLFSAFLELNVFDMTHPDLGCVPEEYINYIVDSWNESPDSGDIIHLMMLFTEHSQLSKTGNRKIQLSSEKYATMACEFVLFCKLELEKRKGVITDIFTSYIFNPNMKTIFYIANFEDLSEKIQSEFKRLPVSIQKIQ